MVNKDYKIKAKDLVKKAKEKGLVKTYKEFCQTDIAKVTEVTEQEITYYTSKEGASR